MDGRHSFFFYFIIFLKFDRISKIVKKGKQCLQEEILNKLKTYYEFARNDNGNCYVAKTKEGATITIYHTGRYQVQGKSGIKQKAEQEVREILGIDVDTKVLNSGENKKLFIVYGHGLIANEQLENLLEKIGIQSIKVTNNLGKTIIEELEKA